MPATQRILDQSINNGFPVNDNLISVTNSTALIRIKDQELVRPFINQSITTGGYASMAIDIINRAIECYADNWGGYNECAIKDTTIENAKLFIKYAQNELDWFPAVSVSDDGYFLLEWIGDKYASYVSINNFGIIFLKTHKTIIGGDEDNKTITFADKTDVELKNALWKIFKAINDKESI